MFDNAASADSESTGGTVDGAVELHECNRNLVAAIWLENNNVAASGNELIGGTVNSAAVLHECKRLSIEYSDPIDRCWLLRWRSASSSCYNTTVWFALNSPILCTIWTLTWSMLCIYDEIITSDFELAILSGFHYLFRFFLFVLHIFLIWWAWMRCYLTERNWERLDCTILQSVMEYLYMTFLD